MKATPKTTLKSKKLATLLGLMALAACFVAGLPQQTTAEDNLSAKTLTLRRTDAPLKIEFEPLSPSFKVGESVRFRVKANKDFFLYLFSINREQGRAVLLIPSGMQAGNKYKADRTFVVPNPSVEFVADKPGSEEVVMVGSTRYLNLSTDGYKKSGDFLTATPAFAESQIKSLRIRTTEKEEQPVVKELSVHITGKPRAVMVPRTAPSEDGPMAFISCDREAYRMGDRVRVAFGADRPGWVHVYVLEPDGKSALLKKQAVSGKEVYHMTAKAQSSTGAHSLVAVFSETAEPDTTKSIPGLRGETATKGLSLVSPEQPPYAVYRFYIQAQQFPLMSERPKNSAFWNFIFVKVFTERTA